MTQSAAERLARLEEGVTALAERLDGRLYEVVQRLDRQNGAIADLNRFRYMAAGALWLLVLLTSVFGALVVSLLVTSG